MQMPYEKERCKSNVFVLVNLAFGRIGHMYGFLGRAMHR